MISTAGFVGSRPPKEDRMARTDQGVKRLSRGRYRLRTTIRDPISGKKLDRQCVVDAASRADAERQKAKWRKQLLEELATPNDATPSEPSVSDCVRSWLRVMSPRWKSSTARQYADLSAVIVTDFGDLPISALDGREGKRRIATWRSRLSKRLSATTVNNHLRALRAVLSDAYEDELIGKLPNFARLYLDEGETRSKVLAPWEARLFAEKLLELQPQWWPISELMRCTGLRFGEAAALQANDVDLEERVLHVRRNAYRGVIQDTPKNGRARVVPLVDEALVALRPPTRNRIGRALLFPSKVGTPLSTGVMTKPYRAVREALGWDRRVSAHWWRHSLGDAVRQVADPYVAAKVLGHSLGGISVTGRYVDPSIEEMRTAITRAIRLERVGGTVGGTSALVGKENPAVAATTTGQDD